jgi:hypothetical protein
MSLLEHGELFMRKLLNRWRSYIAYNINTTWKPLSKGPFHAALKALRLETNNTKGPNPY